jgi:hypothetical protein
LVIVIAEGAASSRAMDRCGAWVGSGGG